MTIALVSTVLVNDHFDFLTDVLHGLNVRHYNYLAEEVAVELDYYHDDRFDEVFVPVAVLVYDDGLDYDLDGNAYFDDYPSDVPHSYHHTLYGAQAEAAWLEHHGVKPNRISIVEGYLTYKWDTQYKPIGV
jgi:hypothetical protein